MLEQDAAGLRSQCLVQTLVRHLGEEIRIVFDAALAATHRALHAPVLRKLVSAENLKHCRLLDEPVLKYACDSVLHYFMPLTYTIIDITRSEQFLAMKLTALG